MVNKVILIGHIGEDMVNKVILIGYTGSDPELKTYNNNEGKIATFSLATTYKTKATVKTEWHSIASFGHTAEFVDKYIKKGTKLYVEGRIETSKWEDKEGNEKSKVSIISTDVKILKSPHTIGIDSSTNNDKVPF